MTETPAPTSFRIKFQRAVAKKPEDRLATAAEFILGMGMGERT